jgi:hypothetical protein
MTDYSTHLQKIYVLLVDEIESVETRCNDALDYFDDNLPEIVKSASEIVEKQEQLKLRVLQLEKELETIYNQLDNLI